MLSSCAVSGLKLVIVERLVVFCGPPTAADFLLKAVLDFVLPVDAISVVYSMQK